MQRLILALALVAMALLPTSTLAQDDIDSAPIAEEEILEITDEELLPVDPEAEDAADESSPPEITTVEDNTEIVRGRVLEIISQTSEESDDGLSQRVKVELKDGTRKGETVEFTHGGQSYLIKDRQLVSKGEQVIVFLQPGDQYAEFIIIDRYRLPSILMIVAVFFVVVIAISRWRGVTSLIGLVVSITILAGYVLPKIAEGSAPLAVTIPAGVLILAISLLIAHGYSKRSLTALVSALLTFGLAIGLSILAVTIAKLSGFGSEDAAGLQFSLLGNIDFRGLLLAGILIGTLGVLDDITVNQTMTVSEIADANPQLSTRELFTRGFRVGREHIASLINTLALAYAGTALPILLFVSFADQQPIWLTANSEFIAEEIVRTVAGSLSLVLAVPIATYLAARVFGKKPATPAAAAPTTSSPAQ